MKILYILAFGLDLISYPFRFLIQPQSFKEMWGLRDVILVQINYQQIAKEQLNLYRAKINKEMEANRLHTLALEQDKEDGQDIQER